MGRKSNKLYAIRVIPISIQRDRQLSEILGSVPVEDPQKKYIAGGGYGLHISDNFSHIKIWKTYNGCKRYMENVVIRNGGSFKPLYGDASGLWDNLSYEVLQINDEWNRYIDKEIERENERHERAVKKLITSKI